MESSCPFYLCTAGQGHFLVLVWKGRQDWATKGQENVSGSEYET